MRKDIAFIALCSVIAPILCFGAIKLGLKRSKVVDRSSVEQLQLEETQRINDNLKDINEKLGRILDRI